MARMSITFKGFEDLAEQVDKAGDKLKTAVDDALTETQRIVQNNVQQASNVYARKGGGVKGYATGQMFSAIKNNIQIEWSGNVAIIHVGFDLKAPGGFHSIFVMYGTPRMAKNAKVYNAIFGAKTKKQIAEAQKKAMEKYLKLGG